MAQYIQRFFCSAISGGTVTLAKDTSVTEGLDSLPSHLNACTITIATYAGTGISDFYSTTGCRRYRVQIDLIT